MKLLLGTFGIVLILFLLPACQTTQPSMAFREESGTLVPHTTTILLPPDKYCELNVEELYFPILPEESILKTSFGTFYPAGKHINTEKRRLEESIGNRELLVTATIYRNGYLSGFEVITDAIGSVVTHHAAPITNPKFYSGKIGSDYVIVTFQAFEINSLGAVRAVRQLTQENLSNVNSSYNVGTALGGGVVKILKGSADVLLSVTGAGLDDWMARYKATKVLEHTIVIRPGDGNSGPEKLYIVTNNAENSFMDAGEDVKDNTKTEDTDGDNVDAVATTKVAEETKDADVNGADPENEVTKNTPDQTSVMEKVRSGSEKFMVTNKLNITDNAYMVISVKTE